MKCRVFADHDTERCEHLARQRPQSVCHLATASLSGGISDFKNNINTKKHVILRSQIILIELVSFLLW